MQRFQYSQYLYLLWLIIPMIALFIWALKWKKRTIQSHFSTKIFPSIFPHYQKTNLIIKFSLLMLSFIFLILAIANPQVGTKQEKIKGQGIDIMLLLDVSNSMMAEDIQPNRLERSKLFISKLLENLKSDRVGLVIFAGNAFLQVPLTIDFSSIKMAMPIIDPSSVPSQGTNIGEAVDMAGQSLGLSNTKHKAIVLITDGEDHDENANRAIETARKNGIIVFAIGVGEEKGAPIPLGNDVKKDENGQTILTAFNRKMLEELANSGKGNFYHLGHQSDIIEEVVAGLNQIEGKDYEEFDNSNFNSYFFWFALVAFALLVIEFIIPEVDFKSFARRIAILFLILISSQGFSQKKAEKKTKEKAQSFIRKGNIDYQNKNYHLAEVNYRKSLNQNTKNLAANYNLGNALYEQKKYQEAAEYYQKNLDLKTDKITKARTFHNIGNTFYKANQIDLAIKAYEQALKLNPNDQNTKFNLAMAKKQNKNQSEGGQKNQQDQKNDQQKQDQQSKSDDKGKPDENKEGEGNKPQEKPQENPKPNSGKGMTKEQADQLLEALKNQEQNTQNKVQNQKQKPDQKKFEKDW